MPKPVSAELARLHTQQSWHRFQARERRRQWAFRTAALAALLGLLIVLLAWR